MPMNRAHYPHNWEEISHRIRFVRGEGRCECVGECGHEHEGGRCGARHLLNHPVTGSKVILTVAHLDHALVTHSDENLKAMCQRCHLKYDRDHAKRIPAHSGGDHTERRSLNMTEAKEAAPELAAQTPAVPPLTAEYNKLKEILRKEKTRFAYWDKMINDQEMKDFQRDLNEKIETEILDLENVDKKDLDQKQANIKAKRWMLSELRGMTSGANVNDAKMALERFEKSNAIFLDAIKSGKDPNIEPGIEEVKKPKRK